MGRCDPAVSLVRNIRDLPRTALPKLETTRKFFIFGDSYADTGNTQNTTAFRFPYGITFPGKPSGRFSDGFVQTDVIASRVLHVASPPAYATLLANTSTSISSGMNYAVGGSGVTYAFGLPTLQTQVQWFSQMVKAGAFTPADLKKAVFLVSVNGNDYGAYNGTLENYYLLVPEVVDLIDLGMRELYSLGARNFMVSSLAPLDCLPSASRPSGFKACGKNSTIESVLSSHNFLLGRKLVKFIKHQKGSNVVYLQQTKAIRHIQKNLPEFNLTEAFKPCCNGLCAEVDAGGSPLYELCQNPGLHMFWDNVHPSQAGWNAVVDLYQHGFTRFSPSLNAWIDGLCK
ncbi:hypothetical protein AXG93_369s1510 [Marchantia polymorpha subsp. ruderalis]|uniref:SGNH hydrolase-type esterase domain-containing protein n=1 Tax=Marchantia polymorpha subsp. ruderalis TaxID=1480154 RepID=A0A176VSY0_MARPO|nr:hypothetical protein AXG93_369s1510 [Marchantia polymorpha subsp. ruderalis]